ncbi:MAG TPA: undecaprenyldiphospho-muramoylpentapeptide beta-N-acetylglucosaminyltransferase [Alphaproteobacteria bacterium]|jgi:UDP-N-acetylglucosamine--N-acetylmuramyl-(pentapeptide) pyrophosphoryl-undecaprenol N-acetylglucosamine transferase
MPSSENKLAQDILVSNSRSHAHPIVLVAGGTGGHVFPAEALATELRTRGYTLALFTDSRGEAYGGELGTLATHRIRAGRVTAGGVLGRAKGLLDLALGGLQSRGLLARLKPSVVVGFGGYASVPTMLAASSLGVPTLIHEQNALLGRANRLLAPRVSAIATAFGSVAGVKPRDRAKIVLTGNPVRAGIRALRDNAYPALAGDGPIYLLVTGGSQGATVFSDVVPAALDRLPDEMRRRLRVSQQCRPEDIERVRAAYAGTDIRVDLASFFTDMPERLLNAHLVICRSGASTIAELTTAGRPALLVPYPHAMDDHQTLNARAVEAQGGAVAVPQLDFTPETLAARLKLLFAQPQHLARMAEKAHASGHRDAAANLAILVAGLLAGSNGKNGHHTTEKAA